MKKRLPALFTVTLILFWLLPSGKVWQPIFAQALFIEDAGSESYFGEGIIFKATVQPVDEINELLVAFVPEGQSGRLEKMVIGENGEATFEIPVNRLAMDIEVDPLQLAPFTQLSYHFEAHLKDGTQIDSNEYELVYEDDRFTWQSREEGIFQVYWNGEDTILGQEIINLADAGLEQAQSILQADPPIPLRIYAYSSSLNLQEALALAGDSWVAGHASPELGIILISIPAGPEQKLELQRQIPHEIMHLLQYQKTGSHFKRQPVWLLEGMASIAELYPNPEYRRMLEDTTNDDNFLAMESLCQSFPDEAGPAFRAYAQSESFVRFLHSTYGTSGLSDLIDNYQDGLGCSEAILTTFGISLGQLEYRWKQEVLGLNTGGLVVRKLSPYLLVGLILLIPVVLSFWSLRNSRRSSNPGNAKVVPTQGGGQPS